MNSGKKNHNPEVNAKTSDEKNKIKKNVTGM